MNQWLTYIKHSVPPTSILPLPFLLLIFPLLALHIILAPDKYISLLFLFFSFFSLSLSLCFTQTNVFLHMDKNKPFGLNNHCSFVPCHKWGSGGGLQQTARVQWIAARESVNWGPCKWTEQGCNQLQSPAKSCLLTHLLKHAGKLTALDFNGMRLKPWRQWPETAKKTLGFFFLLFFSQSRRMITIREIWIKIPHESDLWARSAQITSSSAESHQHWHYGTERGALQALLINYLPVATNAASVTPHRCPQTLIQEIHADNPLKAVLFL